MEENPIDARIGSSSLHRIRARNGEGQAGSRCRAPKMETKVVEGQDTWWKVFRRSLGHGDTWVRVPVLHGV